MNPNKQDFISIAVVLALVGIVLLAIAAWMVYRPAAPGLVGAIALFLARMAFLEARR